jgi:concanavalin A-like lectin/glucanase superfamily protein
MGLLLSRRQTPQVKWRPTTFEQGKSFPLPAPYAGLNLRDDITALKSNEARVLENWVPGTGQLKFRDGHDEHATSVGTGEVKTLASFIGFSSSKLLAAGGGKIFDVTAEGDASDGNDQYTKVLLHFEGTDGGTTITDSNLGGSSHTWTAAGNANTDDAQEKFGTTSLALDGTGDYVSTPDHADFTLGSSNLTVDFWVRFTLAAGAAENLAGQIDAAGSANANSAWLIARTAAGQILFRVVQGTTTTDVTGTTVTASDTWYHVAGVRTGDTLKLFVDGVQEGGDVSFSGGVNDSTASLSVGRAGDAVAVPANGWIDEFRLSVGTARWIAAFSPPTSAYGETVLASGFTNDRWQTATYNNTLHFVNGTDAPQVYNGSTVAANPWDGSGLTITNLVNVALVRFRLWFCENGQAWVWYANVGQIAGGTDLTKFDLGQIAGGGFCMAIGSWSVSDTGDGADDLTVFVMSTGEIIVYQGDPATTFSLVGKYMGAPPIGRQCLVKVGGELVIITRQGFLPVSAAVRRKAGQALDLSVIDPWGKVAPGVATDAVLDADNGGWHGCLHLGLVLFNVPQTEGSISKQWVLNTRAGDGGAWTNFTKWNASSFASFGGDLYFGAMSGGKVMKVTGGNDNGNPIITVANGAFKYPRGPQYSNVYNSARPIIQAGGTVTGIVGVDTDFVVRTLTGETVTLAENTGGGTPWGSPWGSSWGSTGDPFSPWLTIAGEGAAVSVKLRAEATTSEVVWASTDLLYKPGGLRAA